MTKKEICKNSLSIAFSYAFKGFEVKSIIHENSNEIYAISNILTDRKNTINFASIPTPKENTFVYTGVFFIWKTLSSCNRFSVSYTKNGSYPLWITAIFF